MKKKMIYPFLIAVLVLCGAIAILNGTDAAVYDYSKVWTGNGSENNQPGYDLHWILGGNGVDGATLHIVRSDGSTQDVVGSRHGEGDGAMHFYTDGVPGETVTFAEVFVYGDWVNAPLTISDGSPGETTTTTEEETTTTTEEETTTTTEPETTTTTQPPTTTTTPTTEPPTTTTTFDIEFG